MEIKHGNMIHIFQLNTGVSDEDLLCMRRKIAEQLEGGVLTLPPKCKYVTSIDVSERTTSANVVSVSERIASANIVKLTEKNGTWQVPEGVTEVRVILIGGGSGGESGYDGTAFGQYGKPGKGGLGGRIYTDIIRVVPAQVFAYSVAEGGESGSPGGETVFGNLTSRDGVSCKEDWGKETSKWLRETFGLSFVYCGRPGKSGTVSNLSNPFPGRDGRRGFGEGGRGGDGGSPAILGEDGHTIRRLPTPGGIGGRGGGGCIALICSCSSGDLR